MKKYLSVLDYFNGNIHIWHERFIAGHSIKMEPESKFKLLIRTCKVMKIKLQDRVYKVIEAK